MILVHKYCSKCNEADDLVYIPIDMIHEQYDCPICEKGTVNYTPVNS